MAIEFNYLETTRQKIWFKLDDEDVAITLTKDFLSWKLTIPEEKKLSIEELIDICKLIYSKKVIAKGEHIKIILDSNKDCAIIYGNQSVTADILRSVKVTIKG